MEPLYELAADFAWRLDAGLMTADDIPPGWGDIVAFYKLGFTEGQTDRMVRQREEIEEMHGRGGVGVSTAPVIRAGTQDEIRENRRLIRERLAKEEAARQAASEGGKGGK